MLEETGLVDAIETVSPGATRFDVDLAQFSRWRIGGTAAAVVTPRTATEAARVLAAISHFQVPVVVVGETSNLLFDSSGFNGVLVHVGESMSDYRIDGTRVWAQAGVGVPKLARAVASAGLTGIEHVVGIPGTLGGLVLMNGGSQRRGIGENVERIKFADSRGRQIELQHSECGFAYRRSALQRAKVVVLEVVLQLARGSRPSIEAEMDAILSERAAKFPSDLPNCGSTFLSDPEMYSTVGPPGRAIEEAGLKGRRIGGAQVSDKHANFIVNLGGASSDDVLALVDLIRRTVFLRTGYLMDCEVRFVSRAGKVRPAHEAAAERFGDDLVEGVAGA